jgi:hypothetical protein
MSNQMLALTPMRSVPLLNGIVMQPPSDDVTYELTDCTSLVGHNSVQTGDW